MVNYFAVDWTFVVLLLVIGIYALIAAKSMIRMLIGFEIMGKAVTLAIVTAGSANGNIALGQSLAITVIVVEVVFIAIALAIVMLAYRRTKSLDIRKLTKLKG
ncbi:NADH-quinone oxidoreductase subunit K/NAD(P)H-quinone oxidoreductase subunit 4L [Hydrogenispora ethanolica]|uniref:NADH-quinone oxidoreductase subunit K n=1 Tax=Hydrogenispora ethanolica TaxID=1082276 RepID=A0A4R1R5T0_HYDET|nr:NADH-quinone oxidoreductase subunit K [Hydrogenispora ethanolica]TCL60891.1 NADH-quinone oxidoreductase subunit K/NAD(P)H-quinone oxidoreductase subunit 4L [Hydrogenispora ethanolica]